MGNSLFFTSLTAQFALACNLTTAYYLMTFTQSAPGWFFPQAMPVYGLLVYLLNHLFLHRARTMHSLVLLNLAAGGAMLAAYLRLEPWKGAAHFMLVAAFLLWLTLRGCQLALSGPALRSILLTLDASFFLFALFTSYVSFMSLDGIWSLPAIGAFGSSILAAASCRSNRPLGTKAWLAIAAAFGALVLVMLLFLGAAADSAGQFFVAVWTGLTALVRSAGQLLLKLLLALLSLFPGTESEEPIFYEPPSVLPEEVVPLPETNPIIAGILLALLLLAAAALVFWALRRMRTIQLQKRTAGADTVSSGREHPSLPRGIWMLVCSWIHAVRLHLVLWKKRNTPKGLYFLLVRRCRPAPWHKQEGETAREFLLRLADVAREDACLAQALTQLAREVDAAFYSESGTAAPLAYAPMVRHRIGAAARRQLIRDVRSRFQRKTKKIPAP